jgi:hypothetical protein
MWQWNALLRGYARLKEMIMFFLMHTHASSPLERSHMLDVFTMTLVGRISWNKIDWNT